MSLFTNAELCRSPRVNNSVRGEEGLAMLPQVPIRAESSELLAEAAEARELAAAFKDGPAVTDLIAYALALEAEAGRLEENPLMDFDPMLGHGLLDRPVVVTSAHP